MSLRDLNLRQVVTPYKEKLKKIKVALFDVDGILTDGRIFYAGQEVGFNRFFHAQDGYGLKLLEKAGVKVGIITGGNSVGVKERFELLGIKHLFMGDEDKRVAYNKIKKQENVDDAEILYMGDEFFDLPLLKKAGFAATVPNASIEIKEAVDYVTYREGGMGAVREVIDLIRHAQDITPEIEDF